MPRKARLDVPGALHHIIVRGINKTPIFGDDQDKTRFLERLSENITKGTCTVYAWVLMTNHLHLLFKSGKEGISAVMRKQLTWYAQYYNRRHTRTGHLFENRYKSILCDEDTYLLALIRYIHLNPIRREKGEGKRGQAAFLVSSDATKAKTGNLNQSRTVPIWRAFALLLRPRSRKSRWVLPLISYSPFFSTHLNITR